MRPVFGQLIFGGVFDRHPGLQVAYIEGGINWVEGALQDCDFICKSFDPFLDRIQHEPRHYWRTNCFASFMEDRLGLELIDRLGADRLLWSSDYPHLESTFGYSWTAMDEVVKATSAENARKILGGNALRLFNIADR